MAASHALVEKVDALPYRERWQYMVSYGKDGASGNSANTVKDVICELAASPEPAYRILAAMALRGFSSALPPNAPLPDALADTATALVMDLSPKVHKLVISLAVQRTASVEALEAILSVAPAAQFKLLCEAIDDQKATQPAGMRALLSYSRRSDVSQRKHDLLTRHLSADALNHVFAASPLWMLPSDVFQKVVLHQPLWAVQCVRHELEAHIKANAIPAPLLRTMHLALHVLAETGVKENVRLGFELIRDVFHRLPIAKSELTNTLSLYLNHATMDMIDYFLHGDGQQLLPLHASFTKKVRTLLENEFELRCTLSERGVIGWAVSTQFNKGPAGFRDYIYTQRREAIADDAGRLDPSYLELLSRAEDREREARETYQAKGMEEEPLRRMQYLHLLPFSEAAKLADEYMTNPTPEFRIAAVRELVNTARLHPEELKQILQMCVSRGKEQDPFRQAMLGALSDLPVSAWSEPHEAMVQDIMTAAFAAKDISEATIGSLKTMLLAIAVWHPEFAGQCLIQLYTERPNHRSGQHQWRQFAAKASPEVITRLYNTLRPMTDPWMVDDVQTFYRFFSELPEQVVKVIKDTLHPFFVQQLNLEDPDPTNRTNSGHRNWGYNQLEKYFPSEARALVPSLIEKDGTWFNTGSIKKHVLRDLQGPLLTPHLTPEPSKHPKGRPSLDMFRQLESFIYRWSPAQQHTYAQSLMEMINLCDKDVHTQKRYLALFPQIPSASLQDGVGTLAAEDNENVFIRDWALVTMGRMHDRASFDELQRALKDTRQREAAIPIMCRLQKVPAAASIEVLRPALDSKLIMVQKEVARFIGDKADPVAFECLQSFLLNKGDKLQQDVLLAVVRGLWSYMDQDVTWALLDQTVNSPRAAACMAICKIPDHVLPETWQQQKFATLLVNCLKHSDNSVKIAAMERVADHPQLESPELFSVVLSYVDHYKPGRLGEMAVAYMLRAASIPSLQVADKLLSTSNPHWLKEFVDDVCDGVSNHPRGQVGSSKVQEIAALMADRLIESRRLPELACKLVFALDPTVWMPRLTRMQASGLMHPQCAMTAVSLAGNYSPYDDEFISRITTLEAEQLRTHAEPFFRRLGLALLEKCGSRNNWSSATLKDALVNTYRNDVDMWVHDAAQLTEIPGDMQPKQSRDEL